RFPRRQIAAGLIEREVHILPRIAPHLPLPIPVPLFAGQPDEAYPYPFAGYKRLEGITACQRTWTEAMRAENAIPLARFLSALHGIPVDAPTRAAGPGDEIERTNLRKRAPMVQERLRAMASRLPDADIPALCALVDRLAETPPHNGP